MKRAFAGVGATALIAGLGLGWTGIPAAGPLPDLSQGRVLYAENCAACHGAQLQGQPDWRTPGADGLLPAPPHDAKGHTWHHSDRVLSGYTKLGGKASLAQQGAAFDSGMPGFGNILTDRQIADILGYIRSTWPEDIRQAQAERSKADPQDGAN